MTLEQAEHFLLNLRYCSLPVSFELFGTHEAISLGFTSRSPDFFQVRQQLQAYFPEAVLAQESDLLSSQWDDQKPTVIIDFGFSQEFMRPLRIFRRVEPDPLIITLIPKSEKGNRTSREVKFPLLHIRLSGVPLGSENSN